MRKTINAIDEGVESKINMSGEPLKLTPSTRKLANKKLAELGNYHDKIPLDKIFNLLKEFRIIVIDEDEGTPWSGMLMGSNSHTSFSLVMLDPQSEEYRPVSNAILFMSWYKMQSGKFEIVSYLS